MDEIFEIPVLYKNQELSFPAKLLLMGYVHKFEVDVYGQQYFFERDDHGEYRALVSPDEIEHMKNTDVGLLKAIALSIESILK